MDAFYQKLIALSVLMNIVVACDTQEQLANGSETKSAQIAQNKIEVDSSKSIKSCQRLMSSCHLRQK